MKLKNFIPAIIGGLIVAVVMVVFAPSGDGVTTNQESAYDRVMRTGTLRCGYTIRPPFIVRDPNTGELSGIFYEYANAVGKILNLKVDFDQEVGWGEFIESLNTGKIDMFCGPAWPKALRGLHIQFVEPPMFEQMVLWARKDDTRFDYNMAAVNHPEITISAIDGSAPLITAKKLFPQASFKTLAELSPVTDPLEDVKTGKADLVLSETYLGQKYAIANDQSIRMVPSKEPLEYTGITLSVAKNEGQLKHALDLATDELLASGDFQDMVQKYMDIPVLYHIRSKPYGQN